MNPRTAKPPLPCAAHGKGQRTANPYPADAASHTPALSKIDQLALPRRYPAPRRRSRAPSRRHRAPPITPPPELPSRRRRAPATACALPPSSRGRPTRLPPRPPGPIAPTHRPPPRPRRAAPAAAARSPARWAPSSRPLLPRSPAGPSPDVPSSRLAALRQARPPARRHKVRAPRRCFEVDTGGGVARVSEGASQIFLEVDTGGGVAVVFEGPSRIFKAPVKYEDLPDELKKKHGEVKATLEAELIGSFHRTRSHGVSINMVELGYRPGKGSSEGSCSHSKNEEGADPRNRLRHCHKVLVMIKLEADSSDRTGLSAPPALPVFGVDLTGDGKLGGEQQQAFDEIKRYLTTPPVLVPPQQDRPFYIYLSVADTSIASVVVQLYEGVEKVVFYLSRRMLDAETRYPEVEKLCLCLFFTCTKLHHILLTAEIFVICKSDVVKHMLSAPVLKGRLGKWMFALSEFDLRYQPAKAVKGQALADLIAERISTNIAALSIRAWAMFFDGSACDDGCGIAILLVSPRGAEYSFSIRLSTPCTNNVAEYEAVRKGMELLLEAGAEAVELFGDSKLVINQLTDEYKCESESLFPYWMECRELMTRFRYINFNWVPRAQNTEANNLAQMASGYIDIPEGSEVQANGQAEASNQSLIKLIKRKIDENPRDWHEKLSEALWAYRMSCHGAIKTSPYQLVYGQEAVLPWEITAGSRRVTFQNDPAEEYAALMSDTIEDATELRLWSLEKIKENKARVARAYNKKVRPKEFQVGDLVWEAVLPLGTRDKAYGKWSPNWHGPYKVVQALKGNAYMLEELDG
ncbi:hypothetical protein QYE76_024800 [Lolium multiflorum]|uniref:RNase H type-1 domain-containing protein n=1 Tax=Lolium multiflorum TaxID=4521 RepID=A0AAD8RCT1_LOLMU|nr:hypothetical protein QYE76_024800 [Lolium multiflorum]